MSYENGLDGERQAEAWLCARGMRCLEKRFRAADGEIDLVMDDQGTVVFVEVKARPGGRAGDGLCAVTQQKQRRMTHAAASYLNQRGWNDRPARFDVVEITRDGVRHVANAFQAQG